MASKPTIIDVSTLSKPKPSTSAPISPLKTDIAAIYTYAHPALILALYAYQFPAIVADPVPALLNILAPLAVLQIAYVAVCLPPTGETAKEKIKKTKPGEKKKAIGETGRVAGTIVVS
jgi:phosphatidylinositol glycan class F